jgi:Bacterial protein of unknown function (DUF885)
LVADWATLEAEVIEGFFRFSPQHARVAGDHRFDGVVGDASGTTIDARMEEIDRQLLALQRLEHLTRDQEIDRRALQAQLETARFELSELRRPNQEPMYYAGFGSELDVSTYLKRPYAPLPERLHALRRHLNGYPGYLEAARANLDDALPRPNLEIALQAIEGQVEYLDTEVRAVAGANGETAGTIDQAVAQVRDFARFLRAQQASAHNDYALGEERFLAYLKKHELVQLDVPTLEQMVRADIERNSAAAEAAAGELLAGGDVPAALATLEEHHPTAETIIADVSATLDGLVRFIETHKVASIPSPERCQVRPTPPYASYISAAMDSAGPLETVARESFYYVTVPTASWGKARADEWLRHLNYAVLENVSIHEAYPGHYLQSLHERLASSRTRQMFWSICTGEGFAHYVEQMMIEVGYSTDPRLRLAQLEDALLRDCRFLVAIGLHCRQMPMADAVQVFKSVAHVSQLPAEREATRGAWDPLYLCYTLGKLQILDLRRALQARPGFSLGRFHDAFLGCANLPVPLIRDLIL